MANTPPPENPPFHDHLVIGLVGDRANLYQNSAFFRSMIENLAKSLPLWVDGIAADADNRDEEAAEAIRRMEMTPGATVFRFPAGGQG